MQLNTVKRVHKNRDVKRVARGGKRGKTSGRGTKGQKARAGHRIRPEMRDIIKKFPKLRGYKNQSFEVKPTPVSLTMIDKAYSVGETVSPTTLLAKKVVNLLGGRTPKVKILATGTLTKSVTVEGCTLSEKAAAAVAAAGGKVNTPSR